MNYLFQFLWILLFSFLGEGLHALLPWPIPASIYGMVLLFAALSAKLIRLDQVKDAGQFLIRIMGVLFVCPAVGLLGCWELMRENLIAILVIILISLVLTFLAAGWITQFLMKRKEKAKND